MTIPEINAKTMQHGIKTLDWDKDRGKSPPYDNVVAKINFCKTKTFRREEVVQDYTHYNLSTMRVEEIANLFVQIVQSNQHRYIKGQYYNARNIHVQDEIGPNTFLFLLGDKEDPSKIPAIHEKTMQHGIKTRRWDENTEPPDHILLAKVNFCNPGTFFPAAGVQNYPNYDLSTMSVDAIANLFVQIMQSNQHRYIDGEYYSARSIHVKNEIGPDTLLLLFGLKDPPKIPAIHEKTIQHGIKTLDWDKDRINAPYRNIVAKINFCKAKTFRPEEFVQDYTHYNLSTMQVEEIANLFVKFVQFNQHRCINGQYYNARNIYVKGDIGPDTFLFLLGDKEDPSKILAIHEKTMQYDIKTLDWDKEDPSKIPAIHEKTIQHGIKTLRWDENTKPPGPDILLAKINFCNPGTFFPAAGVQNYSNYDLSTMSVDAIANLFVQIVQSNQHRYIDGEYYSARNIYVKNEIGPDTFLFVLGDKDPSKIPAIHEKTIQHGIKTLDWEESLDWEGDREGLLDDILVAKINFRNTRVFSPEEDLQNYMSYDLSKMSVDGIAHLFVQIVYSNQHRNINGQYYSARNIHVKGNIGPDTFLFLCGHKDP